MKPGPRPSGGRRRGRPRPGFVRAEPGSVDSTGLSGGTWVMESPKSNTRGQTRELPHPTVSHSAITLTAERRSRPDIRAGRTARGRGERPGAGRAAHAQSHVLLALSPGPGIPPLGLLEQRFCGGHLAILKRRNGCWVLESSILPVYESSASCIYSLSSIHSYRAVRCGSDPALPEPTDTRREERPEGPPELRLYPPSGPCRCSVAQVETIPETRAVLWCHQKRHHSPFAGGFKYSAKGNRRTNVRSTSKEFIHHRTTSY